MPTRKIALACASIFLIVGCTTIESTALTARIETLTRAAKDAFARVAEPLTGLEVDAQLLVRLEQRHPGRPVV